MALVIDDTTKCNACDQPRVNGVTHHLSRCPYRPSNREAELRKRDREDFWKGRRLKWWYQDHQDEVFVTFCVLFCIGLVVFFLLYHE